MRSAVATLVALVVCSPAFAISPGVHDGATLFKPETVSRATEIIKEIKRNTGREVLIETFTSPPPGKNDEANTTDARAKDRFFSNWAVEPARETGVNGIYVLVCREPSYVKVAVGDKTRQTFSDSKRDRLGSILVSHFKEKKFDEGLLEGVRYIHTALEVPQSESNKKLNQPTPDSKSMLEGTGSWLCLGLVVLLVVVGVILVIRAMSGGGSSIGGPGPGGYAGGGFWPSLLGGIFGAAAGMWMYDTFFGGHHSTPTAPPPDSGAEPGAMSEQDTDYTAGGGGDYGDTSSDSHGDFGGDGGGFDAGGGGDF